MWWCIFDTFLGSCLVEVTKKNQGLAQGPGSRTNIRNELNFHRETMTSWTIHCPTLETWITATFDTSTWGFWESNKWGVYGTLQTWLLLCRVQHYKEFYMNGHLLPGLSNTVWLSTGLNNQHIACIKQQTSCILSIWFKSSASTKLRPVYPRQKRCFLE